MGRWVVGIILKGLTAILCVAAMAWLALWYFIPAPPASIIIATGPAGGTLDHIAQRYRISLAPHIKLDQRSTDGVLENLRLLKDRTSGVDVAFYVGGASNSKESPELMSLGRIIYFSTSTEWPHLCMMQIAGISEACPGGLRRKFLA